MDTCEYCDEAIDDEEDRYIPLPIDAAVALFPEGIGKLLTADLHRTCFIRTIVGSVAHQKRTCCCYVRGSVEDDPPGMTPRQGGKGSP